jgi:hypothetical protein
VTWHCPSNDQLNLTSMIPAAGSLQGIGSPSDASKPGRSVQLNYQYVLNSRPNAVIKQVPLKKTGASIPQDAYFTTKTVHKGNGAVSNVLSFYCQSEQQPDVEVKKLRYSLREEGSGEVILQEVVDVDWRFRCKPATFAPAQLQNLPGLIPNNSKARSKSSQGMPAQLKMSPAKAPRAGARTRTGVTPPSRELKIQKVTPAPATQGTEKTPAMRKTSPKTPATVENGGTVRMAPKR